ncbi:MAG: L,D-transpeptidase family protein, partial [Candidatus Latescibacteria bacterium]|nr:L,D-transpeptidase family protein [Candidatus Latescibacterota bacterium]
MPMRPGFYKVVCAGILMTGLWTEPPHEEMALAKSAVEAAVKAGAQRYAKERFQEAQDSLRGATLALRQAYRENLLTRDYGRVTITASAAIDKGYEAAVEAVRNKRMVRKKAEEVIDEAHRTVETTRRAIENLPPDPATRFQLITADVLLGESKLAFSKGEFHESIEKADGVQDRINRTAVAAKSVVERYAGSEQGAAWRKWAQETIAWSDGANSYAIIVDKINRACRLYYDGKLVKSYKADLGPNFMKDKLVAGDRATPEGKYRITGITGPGGSRYYRALHLNYPNAEDLARFHEMKRKGLISKRAGIGGLIEIHGAGGRGKDWTAGCVALRNRDIDDVARRIRVGTPVTIVGYQGENIGSVASVDLPVAKRTIPEKRIVKREPRRMAMKVTRKSGGKRKVGRRNGRGGSEQGRENT